MIDGAADLGFEHGQGIISAAYLNYLMNPQSKKYTDMNSSYAFRDKDFPEGNRADGSVMVGYNVSRTLVEVLKKCGDDLTRGNVMKQAASLKEFASGTLLPGITINTGPEDFAPIQKVQLMKFKGERWELFGQVMSGEVGG